MMILVTWDRLGFGVGGMESSLKAEEIVNGVKLKECFLLQCRSRQYLKFLLV